MRGGRLDELDKHLRMSTNGYLLAKAWFWPRFATPRPLPVLALRENKARPVDHTSGYCRHLVDPDAADSARHPTAPGPVVAAVDSRVITLDNVAPSDCPGISGTLCSL